MIEKKPTPFEAIREVSPHFLVDTLFGLVAQHPELAPIFPNQYTPESDKRSGDIHE